MKGNHHPSMKIIGTVRLILISSIALLQACATAREKHAHPSGRGGVSGTDGVLQGIVEREVDWAMRDMNPRRMTVIAVDPSTGQILAECSRRRGSEKTTSDAYTWSFQPVAAFMPFVMAAAIDDATLNQSSTFDCGHGTGMFSGCRIRDRVPHGELKPDEILRVSSNVGMGRIGARLTFPSMDQYVRSFGFGAKTDAPVPLESAGYVSPSASGRGLAKVRMSIGRSVEVTPIQLAMAYSALANGGVLLKPKKLWDGSPLVVHRVVSEKTARTLRKMLAGTISKSGTAPLASVDGVSVGGKTGTSRDIPGLGNSAWDQNVTLFAGFFPVENPRIVCVVAEERASVAPDCHYAGLICAPIFSRICREALKAGL
jgi:cell division protein FtsI (penicillin-binding protein 3)